MTHPGVTFQAYFKKALTTVDGGWDITFSVSANEGNQVLLASSLRDLLLQIAVIPVEADPDNALDSIEVDLG